MNDIGDLRTEQESVIRKQRPESAPPQMADSKPEYYLPGKKISRKSLINKINLLNFENRCLYASFRNNEYPNVIMVPIVPLPCADGKLDCLWQEQPDFDFQRYHLESFIIEDGPNIIIIIPEGVHITKLGLCADLPESGIQRSLRKRKRFKGSEIVVQVQQDGLSYSGHLIDFSVCSFRIDLSSGRNSHRWINSDRNVHVSFYKQGGNIGYSGNCRFISVDKTGKSCRCILQPTENNRPRFQAKEFRSTRYRLEVTPDVRFHHPLSGTIGERKVFDISGTGVSVLEDGVEALLIPGLMLPESIIILPDRTEISCGLQVIYRQELGDGKAKCGLAILEISPRDHLVLLATLHQAHDPNSYLCKKVDMRELWKFFFESGFIYPEKYNYIQKHKERIKSVYEKLYQNHPAFARHFTYQKEQRILGHLAMVRFFEKSWLIQHHASSSMKNLQAGIHVLKQVGSFANDAHNFDPMNLDYCICFYRPDNKFPHKIFGGVAENASNPKQCSLDPFAYFHIRRGAAGEGDVENLWELRSLNEEDIQGLQYSYENQSGGLLLDAVSLSRAIEDDSKMIRQFREIGIERSVKLYALTKNGLLNAVFIQNRSDLGLNLSELTNSIMVLVLQNSDISTPVLYSFLSRLAKPFDMTSIPVLLFPLSFAENKGIPYEKIYNCWVLDNRYGDVYFRYLQKMLRKAL